MPQDLAARSTCSCQAGQHRKLDLPAEFNVATSADGLDAASAFLSLPSFNGTVMCPRAAFVVASLASGHPYTPGTRRRNVNFWRQQPTHFVKDGTDFAA
jgi:hypothetical protein